MAGKEKDMSKVKQMLRLHHNGVSNRQIAKDLSVNKETVNRYVKLAKSDELSITDLLKLDDPVLQHRINGGSPSYPEGERFDDFKKKLSYFEDEMKRPHVTLKLLWEEYIAEHPKGYGLTQFRYHYRQHTKAKRPVSSSLLKDLYTPGEKLMIDYAGDRLEYVDRETGEIVKVQVFVACMPATDYGFAIAVRSQRSEDFIHALAMCLGSLGGVPKIVVSDNLKAAVVKTDPHEPKINRILEDMANHYGFVVIPARSGKPKDKSLVENQVKIVYNRVYAQLRNQKFYSLEELNKAIGTKMQAHNRKRMQQHPYTREEQFIATEKPELRPLPKERFEVRFYASLKVNPNGFVYLGRDKHHYSTPHVYIGQQTSVIYTRSLVKIYINGECVAMHKRSYNQGKYTYEKEHLASNTQAYRDRSPQYYVRRAQNASQELGEVVEYMFATATVPVETFYKGCEGLLKLQRDTDPHLFKKACDTALLYQKYRYGFIERLIRTECRGVEDVQCRDLFNTFPSHDNVRGKEEYN
jgi:transposase